LRPQAQEIWKAREAAEEILHRLCARTFGYALEAREGGWMLRVEYAGDGGWQAVSLPVEPDELCASLTDQALRERLIGDWRRRLDACAGRTEAAE
jgi:hypothetical protein